MKRPPDKRLIGSQLGSTPAKANYAPPPLPSVGGFCPLFAECPADSIRTTKWPGQITHLLFFLQVGAATESELEDKKLRVEDAKNATFAAVEEGVVPGGGAALLHLRETIPAFKETLTNSEERLGADIVYKSLRVCSICCLISGIWLCWQCTNSAHCTHTAAEAALGCFLWRINAQRSDFSAY